MSTKLGRYANLISEIRKKSNKKISQAQVRLIMKKLEALSEPEDEDFIKAVLQYTNLSERFIRGIIKKHYQKQVIKFGS